MTTSVLTVKNIEHILFSAFPKEDATPGDRLGLLVGSIHDEVIDIALALDATPSSIEAAAQAGCNVLVTHHPVFWPAPTEFLKEGSLPGCSIYTAARQEVSLIAMHTNLDCAPVAREMLLEPAGFKFWEPLSYPHETEEELQNSTGRTFGQHRRSPSVWEETPQSEPVPALGQLGVPLEGSCVSLGEIAKRYRESFGAVAKVWGEPDTPIEVLATCSGGGGSLTRRVIASGAHCYVTGELAYHEALELTCAGIAVIELGHDRSELPYRFYLKEALVQAGIDEARITVLEPTISWWH